MTSAVPNAGRRRTPAMLKELRALLPAWLVTAVLTLLIRRPVSHGYPGYEVVVVDLALVTFFLGTALVGSLAIGHEYLYGTVGLLLAQPARRRDVLLTKLVILLPLEIALAVLFRSRVPGLGVPVLLWSVDVLPVVAAITVAPWLTMVCRNALAGAVFTMAALGVCCGAGFLAGLPLFTPVFIGGEVLLCAVGAVMSWRTFMRLEALGSSSGGESIVVARGASSAVAATDGVTRTRPRAWLVVRKELRLQLPSMVVAALYAAGCLVFSAAESNASDVSQALYGITPLYIGLITLLIGAVSSAEERQIGTAEWQVILPMAARAQWAIKVLVTLAVLAGLALVTPAAVLSIVPVTRVLVTREAATTAVLFTLPLVLIAMYVSSLSRNSLTAFLAAALTAVAVWMGVVYFFRPAGMGFLGRLGGDAPWRLLLAAAPRGLSRSARTLLADLFPAATAILAIAPLAVSAYFAMRNHRSAERGAGRILRQLAWMTALVVITTSVWATVGVAQYWDQPLARRQATRRAIEHVTSGTDGDVGVCALVKFEAACVNPIADFPMAGTWRLPVVVAALRAIDTGALQPDDSINASLSRALTDDDAAASLARAVSGTPVVDSFWLRDFTRGLLVRGASHLQDITTPAQIAYLLGQGGTPDGRLLSSASTERLRDLVTQAGSAGGGLRAGVPAGWTTWELSATTVDAAGAPASTNDVGLLRAPDGTFIVVAAFISDSHASAAERTAFFAKVARAVVDAY